MKSVPEKILLDTNSYLRLANSVHPLLKQSFGNNNYTLYIHKFFEVEFSKQPRLVSKFHWVNKNEYLENRKNQLKLSVTEKEKIYNIQKFMREASFQIAPSVSLIDIKCLATAFSLNIPVVTDDSDMLILANEYEIKTYKTLELMKLMLECGHIDFEKIEEIVSYWIYIRDIPKNFKIDYELIFKKTPPTW